MSVAATLAPAAPPSAQDPIRVMVVDDAVVVRGLVSRWIDEEPDLKIVASLRTGRDAVDQVSAHNPDVVVLDIEMPDLDGLDGAAAAAREEARPDRHHGVDADAPQRRGEPEGALARRRRLHPEAGDQPRGHHLGDLPARPDREDPPARRAAQTRRRGAARARAVQRSPVRARAAPSAAARTRFSVAEPRAAAQPAAGYASTSSCGRSRRCRRACC